MLLENMKNLIFTANIEMQKNEIERVKFCNRQIKIFCAKNIRKIVP